MVDRLRAYRRWRRRRLALLLPVFLGALGTQFWLTAGSSAPAWLRLVSLGTSGLILALIGYFVAQTLFCAHLHTRGNRVGARVVREQLAPSGRAALAAAALLALLNTVPYLIPSDPGRTIPLRSGRRFLLRPEAVPSSVAAWGDLELFPSVALPETPTIVPARPTVRPILESLPLQLAAEQPGSDSESRAVLAFLGGLPQEPKRPSGGDSEDDVPKYRSDEKDGFLLTVEHERSTELNRLGVPGERSPKDWLPPELSLEISFLKGGAAPSFRCSSTFP
jgi:hypothetical protein